MPRLARVTKRSRSVRRYRPGRYRVARPGPTAVLARRMRAEARLGPGAYIINPQKREETTTLIRTNYTVNNIVGPLVAGTANICTFDPSGLSATFLGGPTTCPDYSNCATLFSKYRVNSIEVRWSLAEAAAVPYTDLVIWQRYSTNASPAAGGTFFCVGGSHPMQEWADVQANTLTADQPSCTYLIDKPMVQTVTVSGGATPITSSYTTSRMGWTDVSQPAVIYGYAMGMPWGLPASTQLLCSITYNISFKTSY